MTDAISAQVAFSNDKALEIVFGKPEEGVHQGAVRNERQRRVKYWRKPDHPGATDAGWIMTGPDIQTDAPKYQQYIEKGRRELPDRFGKEVTGQPTSTISWEANNKQRRNPESWLEPFIAGGGLTYVIQPNDSFGTAGQYLMPASQIVAYGLHRKPGIKELRPDLSGAVDVECELGCINEATRKRQVFSGLDEEDARKNRDQHMVAKHRESEGARAVGSEISKRVEEIRGGGGIDPNLIAQIVAATVAALKGQETPPSTPMVTTEPPKVAFDINTASRQDMMAFAAQTGQYPDNGAKMNAEAWRDYLRGLQATAAAA